MTLTVIHDRTADLMRAVDDLTKSRVLIGVPGDAPARKPDEPGGDTISNALIGYLAEHGAPDQHVPQRPWLVPGVEAATEAMTARLRKAAEAAITGDAGAVETQLTAVGLIGANAAKAQINDGTFAPLSERTLAARRARGRTGEKPLVDTGAFRNSVTSVVQMGRR